MKKLFPKSLLTLTGASLLLSPILFSKAVLSESPVPQPRVIQGTVTSVSGNIITVITPLKPVCPSGVPAYLCPPSAINLLSSKIDISGAIYQTSSGDPTSPQAPVVNERVVIGAYVPANFFASQPASLVFKAQVIERPL